MPAGRLRDGGTASERLCSVGVRARGRGRIAVPPKMVRMGQVRNGRSGT